MGYLSSLMGCSWEMKCVDQSCVGCLWEMKCVDQSCVGRSCVGRSEKWSDERVDRRNEGNRPEKWADWTVFMSGSEWETEKENSPCVDRSLELLCSVCGSFSWSLVCGSELVKLCVCVRELSGKYLKWKWGLNMRELLRVFIGNQ